eukprot:TRINITY_DN15555_c0_g1_i1.p1 TRINITY_DN15555_c0_g1~~TRINITY_DN15555_c0_g1_i1.p1  ORF type:complete len:704 (+),score=81.79 TRINITY_DN15555_c0_g1_i1:29-2113(+)
MTEDVFAAEDVFDEWLGAWEKKEQEFKQSLAEVDDLEFEWSDEASGKAPLNLIGGLAIRCFKSNPNVAVATLVVVSFPSMEVVFEGCRPHHCSEPAVNGFLAFRQAPPLLDHIERLRQDYPHLVPQLLFVDGGGTLHTRGCGLAVHVGVGTDIPTVGVSGWVAVDGLSKDNILRQLERGVEAVGLLGQSGRHWGMAFMPPSREPIFVSVGHRVSLMSAVAMTKACTLNATPEPLKIAIEVTQEYMRQMAAASGRPSTPQATRPQATPEPQNTKGSPPNPRAARSAEIAAERARQAAIAARSGKKVTTAPAAPVVAPAVVPAEKRASNGEAPAFFPSESYVGPRAGWYFRLDVNGLGYYRDPTGAQQTPGALSDFQPAQRYQGSRDGWVFKLDRHGLGYYREASQSDATDRRHSELSRAPTQQDARRHFSVPEKKNPMSPRKPSASNERPVQTPSAYSHQQQVPPQQPQQQYQPPTYQQQPYQPPQMQYQPQQGNLFAPPTTQQTQGFPYPPQAPPSARQPTGQPVPFGAPNSPWQQVPQAFSPFGQPPFPVTGLYAPTVTQNQLAQNNQQAPPQQPPQQQHQQPQQQQLPPANQTVPYAQQPYAYPFGQFPGFANAAQAMAPTFTRGQVPSPPSPFFPPQPFAPTYAQSPQFGAPAVVGAAFGGLQPFQPMSPVRPALMAPTATNYSAAQMWRR